MIFGTGAIAIALASSFAAATISAGEGTPAVMLVIVPKGLIARAPTAAFVDAAASVLAQKTRIALKSAEQAGVDLARIESCDPAERHACWISAVRRDPAGGCQEGAPQSARRDCVGQDVRRESPKYLFVLAVHPGDAVDTLTLVSLDIAEADRRAALIPANAADRREAVENEIYASAIKSPPVQVDSRDRSALEKQFEGELFRSLAAHLEKTGDLGPLGKIEVHSPARNWTVLLDGKPLATTSTGALTITDVAPGSRRIDLQPSSGQPLAQKILVLSGSTADARFAFGDTVPTDDGEPMRYGLIFAGVGMASVGGVLLASSISRAGNVREACIVRNGDAGECEQLGAITFSHDAGALPSFDPERVNPRGLQMAPLGIGLVGGGIIIAAGTYFLDEYHGEWWWPVVAGVGFGAATVGLGFALDPR